MLWLGIGTDIKPIKDHQFIPRISLWLWGWPFECYTPPGVARSGAHCFFLGYLNYYVSKNIFGGNGLGTWRKIKTQVICASGMHAPMHCSPAYLGILRAVFLSGRGSTTCGTFFLPLRCCAVGWNFTSFFLLPAWHKTQQKKRTKAPDIAQCRFIQSVLLHATALNIPSNHRQWRAIFFFQDCLTHQLLGKCTYLTPFSS